MHLPALSFVVAQAIDCNQALGENSEPDPEGRRRGASHAARVHAIPEIEELPTPGHNII